MDDLDDRDDGFEDFEIETPGDDDDDDAEMVLGDLAAGQGLVHIIDEVRLYDMRGGSRGSGDSWECGCVFV
jgi:hypothetical protein